MNINDQELAHRIKLKFGTAPQGPSEYQLSRIKADILAIAARKGIPTEEDWFSVVKQHCPDAGNYVYMGEDNSDLITLLLMARKQD